MPSNLQEWSEAQDNDPELNVIKDLVLSDDANIIARGYLLDDAGVLMQKDKIGRKRFVLPSALRRPLLKQYHDHPLSGHFGIFKTTRKISEKYVWKGMKNDIASYIRGCDLCQKVKPPNKAPYGFMNSRIATETGEYLSCDLIGPLVKSARGHEYAFVITDDFSRNVEIFPLRKATSRTVCEKLIDYCCRNGFPRAIRSDNGSQFASRLWDAICRVFGINPRKIVPYRPQGNPTERANRNIKQVIKMYAERHSEWDRHLNAIGFALRTSVNETTGFTPAKLTFGKELLSPFDPPLSELSRVESLQTDEHDDPFTQYAKDLGLEMEKTIAEARINCNKAHEQQTSLYNKHRTSHNFKVGDIVLRRVHVLSSADKKIAGSPTKPCRIEIEEEEKKKADLALLKFLHMKYKSKREQKRRHHKSKKSKKTTESRTRSLSPADMDPPVLEREVEILAEFRHPTPTPQAEPQSATITKPPSPIPQAAPVAPVATTTRPLTPISEVEPVVPKQTEPPAKQSQADPNWEDRSESGSVENELGRTFTTVIPPAPAPPAFSMLQMPSGLITTVQGKAGATDPNWWLAWCGVTTGFDENNRFVSSQRSPLVVTRIPFSQSAVAMAQVCRVFDPQTIAQNRLPNLVHSSMHTNVQGSPQPAPQQTQSAPVLTESTACKPVETTSPTSIPVHVTSQAVAEPRKEKTQEELKAWADSIKEKNKERRRRQKERERAFLKEKKEEEKAKLQATQANVTKVPDTPAQPSYNQQCAPQSSRTFYGSEQSGASPWAPRVRGRAGRGGRWRGSRPRGNRFGSNLDYAPNHPPQALIREPPGGDYDEHRPDCSCTHCWATRGLRQ
ncbi:hypothetical protein B566_EDAN016378 [Ephemera danica]|nr:hypothetical protein B566_EDAN016378 [Ephemera danica]